MSLSPDSASLHQGYGFLLFQVVALNVYLSRCISLLFVMFFTSVSCFALEAPKASIAYEADDYVEVNVSQMIKLRAKPGDKQRYFIKPTPVRFSAIVMQSPKAGKFELVYDALTAWGVSPLPEVGHGAYLKVEGDKVIPVYLEKQAADFINTSMTVQQQAEFYALHIYNYEKGPRFLVVSVNAGSVK